MGFLPKTAIGLFSLIIFTGWLIAMMFTTITSLADNIDRMKTAQNDLTSAATDVTQSDSIIGSVSGVFSIGFNLIMIIFGFFAMLFSSMAGFISVITELPIEISQIFIALLLAGSIFALISKVVET